MLLKTGEQIERDLYYKFKDFDIDEISKEVKIDSEIIEEIIGGSEFEHIKEWLKLIEIVTQDVQFVECSDMINLINESIMLYGTKKKYKIKYKARSRKHLKFYEITDFEKADEEYFGVVLTLPQILKLFEFQNKII